MKPLSLLIAALAAAATTSADAAKPPKVGDIITLHAQTLACFDLENTKELERTRAMDGGRVAIAGRELRPRVRTATVTRRVPPVWR